MKNINTLADLLSNITSISPAGALEGEKSAKAELHMYEDENNLPRLHFTWIPVHFVYFKTEADAQIARDLGFDVKADSSYESKGWFCYVKENTTSHLWLCNFRRYGWSFTSEPKGEYGYGHGVTYANGPALHGAETEEQVVRDALIATWYSAVTSELVPSFFNGPAVHRLLNTLLEDALKNLSRHARPRPIPSYDHDVQTGVITSKPVGEVPLVEVVQKS